MQFIAERLPYKDTGYFSRVITDYLEGVPALKPFYDWPVSWEGLDAAIRERASFPTDRQTLARVLRDQYQSLPDIPEVQQNIALLEEDSTFTITTAHQPAIFTGHLYFVYKILHAVRLARDLQVRFPGKRFVPVFYMGSEDADFDELGHIFLNREKITWETDQTGAVGRMSTAGLDRIVDRIAAQFSAEPFGAGLSALLTECYLQAVTVQEATLKIIHQLFGRFGVVVLIADEPRLKRLMEPVFRDDLFSHVPFAVTGKTIAAFEETYEPQAKPREINLFYLKENIRERIDQRDEKFVVHGTGTSFTAAGIGDALKKFPERFSPNVILRGLYQATLLPDVAFIGGGGETAYWLELKDLFHYYKVPFPVLVLRNSFLLISTPWANRIGKAGLNAASIFRREEILLEEEVRDRSSHRLDLAAEIAELHALYNRVKKVSAEVDSTLEGHVESLRSRALKGIEELEKKIVRAEKRTFEETRRKIREIREALFPFDELQERVENFMPWYARFGSAFFDALLEHSSALDPAFTVLTETNEPL